MASEPSGVRGARIQTSKGSVAGARTCSGFCEPRLALRHPSPRVTGGGRDGWLGRLTSGPAGRAGRAGRAELSM
eukprot:15469266-Alexandrium_andersonii.AAC.1